MKKLILSIGFLFIISCLQMAEAQPRGTKVVCFKSNMHCEGCAETIREHVRFEKGVRDLKVDYISNTVKIVYTEGKNDGENLAKSIVKKGYKAEMITEEEYEKLVNESKGDNQDREIHK